MTVRTEAVHNLTSAFCSGNLSHILDSNTSEIKNPETCRNKKTHSKRFLCLDKKRAVKHFNLMKLVGFQLQSCGFH